MSKCVPSPRCRPGGVASHATPKSQACGASLRRALGALCRQVDAGPGAGRTQRRPQGAHRAQAADRQARPWRQLVIVITAGRRSASAAPVLFCACSPCVLYFGSLGFHQSSHDIVFYYARQNRSRLVIERGRSLRNQWSLLSRVPVASAS